jgi:hypothetical protein
VTREVVEGVLCVFRASLDIRSYHFEIHKRATMTISEAKAMFAEMLKTWLLHHPTKFQPQYQVPEENLTLIFQN